MREAMERQAACDDEDAFYVERIEVDFAIPTIITQAQLRQLHDLLAEMAREPHNTPVGCVHWLSGHGSKPRFSRADRRFLGMPDDPSAPESGEPTFDDSVLHFTTTCREDYATREEAPDEQ